MPYTTLGNFANQQGAGTSIYPQTPTAQASFGLVGNAVDMQTTDGIVSAWLSAGVTSGSPTNFTVTAKLQESDTSGGTYSDVAGGALPVIGPITSATTVTDVYVSTILRSKRYVKMVATVAFTGGSSPTVGVFGGVIAQKKIEGSGPGNQL